MVGPRYARPALPLYLYTFHNYGDGPLGMAIVNVLPWPRQLSTRIVPPWAATMNLTMLNPKPQPPAERDSV